MDSDTRTHLIQEHEALKMLKGQAEIMNLAKSYDELLSVIQSAFENEVKIKNQMRQFVSDASHELRTPLTSIRGFTEVLEMGAYANPNQLNQGLSSILSESERMEKLVSNLLTLNHLDQNRLNAEDVYSGFETINLSALIEEMAPQLKILALNRKIEFKIDPRIEIKGQRNGLKQVVLNLFQNAVQHTSPVEGVISIVLERLEDKVSLSISDNGKGMSPDLIPKIFDRFYRGEGHRSREEGGYGLGLAIVKSLVELHRGEVKVESNMGDGSTFTVIFSIDE